jgi:Bacteriophage lambda head decoration protein D
MTLTVTSMGDNPSVPLISAETYIPDQLIAGNLKLVTASVTLTGAHPLTRGAVLGQLSTSGYAAYKLSAFGAGDGSAVPLAILADNADPSNGNVTCGVYLMGEFDQNYINFDPSWSLDALGPLLRKYGIFLKPTVVATDPVGE